MRLNPMNMNFMILKFILVDRKGDKMKRILNKEEKKLFDYACRPFVIFAISVAIIVFIGIKFCNMSEDTANGFISSLLLLFVIVYVNLSMIEVSEIKITAKDNDKEKEKDKITPRYFIKKDSYMCPCCGCVVERRDLPNFPELDIAEDVRDELLCPYCGNLGLNYMISDDKMIGYTIYGRKEK